MRIGLPADFSWPPLNTEYGFRSNIMLTGSGILVMSRGRTKKDSYSIEKVGYGK